MYAIYLVGMRVNKYEFDVYNKGIEYITNHEVSEFHNNKQSRHAASSYIAGLF